MTRTTVLNSNDAGTYAISMISGDFVVYVREEEQ